MPVHDNHEDTQPSHFEFAHLLEAKMRDLGGFSVGRVLPSPLRRQVGPFVFFDHLSKVQFAPGQGIDVRPHPHINLATVTYLFAGAIQHRDSLGSNQIISPGDINWMTAGRGIVHSERTPQALRQTGGPVHGIQMWVALPKAHEETEPAFFHHPESTLPARKQDGVALRILAGAAYGMTSPVKVFAPTFLVDAQLAAGATLPMPAEYAERAAYVVEGVVHCGNERVSACNMMVFAAGTNPVLKAEGAARLMLIGGAELDGPRHLYWNFVSSSPERIEQAKQDWKNGRFARVPGDEQEFIPLPGLG